MKCVFCKEEIKEVSNCYIDTSGKRKAYYCNEEHYKSQKSKIKYKPKKTSTDGEPNPRREFLDYIQDIYVENGVSKYKINWTLITAQIKNMMEDNKDMKYTGMKYCLWYMKEVAEVNLFGEQTQTIVSLLPFYYEESKEHWEKQYNMSKILEEFNFETSPVIMKKGVDREENKCYNEIDIASLI